jgi:hypothetical protein
MASRSLVRRASERVTSTECHGFMFNERCEDTAKFNVSERKVSFTF